MVSRNPLMRKPSPVSSEAASEPEQCPAGHFFLKPGTLIDQYIIERPLAGGGFSSVYLARQLDDQMQVAIKEYLPRRLAHRTEDQQVVANDENARWHFMRGRKLFLEEAKVLTRLKHRNIVEVLNFFKANATVYLVMTFEYGKILGEYLLREKKGGLSEQFFHQVFPPLLDGVRMIHANGLLHLDIKPHNIIIRSGGDPLLLDFGACQPFPYEERARIGKVLSTGFSPVEQYDADGVLGPWSDIYALGATMRMCLDGVFPPAATDRAEKDTLVPAAKAFKRRYPPGLLEAIDWAMAIAPEQRPQSIETFLAALAFELPTTDRPAF
jgi:serine/threonine protein kinase